MKSKTTILAIVAIFLISYIFSSAQELNTSQKYFHFEYLAIHARAGVAAGFYSASFSQFQGSTDCTLFESGSGTGFSGLISAELPLNKISWISLGAGYINRSGNLIKNITVPSRDYTGGIMTNVGFENKIKTELSYLEFQCEYKLTMIPDLISGPLKLVAGIRAGVPMTRTFIQSESILAPESAYFIFNNQRTRTREIASGTIESARSFFVGMTVGVENSLKISNKLNLTQNLLFDYNFTDITSDANWKVYAIRFELGLRFGFIK